MLLTSDSTDALLTSSVQPIQLERINSSYIQYENKTKEYIRKRVLESNFHIFSNNTIFVKTFMLNSM